MPDSIIKKVKKMCLQNKKCGQLKYADMNNNKYECSTKNKALKEDDVLKPETI